MLYYYLFPAILDTLNSINTSCSCKHNSPLPLLRSAYTSSRKDHTRRGPHDPICGVINSRLRPPSPALVFLDNFVVNYFLLRYIHGTTKTGVPVRCVRQGVFESEGYIPGQLPGYSLGKMVMEEEVGRREGNIACGQAAGGRQVNKRGDWGPFRRSKQTDGWM